jgi:DNA-binding NtrC family response regulator
VETPFILVTCLCNRPAMEIDSRGSHNDVNTFVQDVRSPMRTRDPVVLVVDDNPQILNALRRCFRNEGFEVITVGSSDEALDWMSEVSVRLVITDQVMPGMTGTELIRVVRQRFPEMPCALLTGSRTPSIAREAAAAQAAVILDKPWSDQELREVTLRLLGRGPKGLGSETGDSAGFDPGGKG